MKNFKKWHIAVGVAVLAGLIVLSSVIVEETEYGVVTRFGRVTQVHAEPGLYWKMPSPIDTVTRIDKRVLFTRVAESEFLTSDKKNLIAAAYVNWRVVDPVRYLSSLRTREAAETRLAALVQSALGGSLGERPFNEFVPTEERLSEADPIGDRLEVLEQVVTDRTAPIAASDLGIEIVDLGVTRLNFPDQNIISVFARMRSERERLSKAYRSEGEAEAQKILAEANRESAELVANAEAEAQKVRGEGEAEAARIYADAYRGNESFYAFLRTLETYEQVFNDKTTLVLPADAPLLQLLLQPPRTRAGE